MAFGRHWEWRGFGNPGPGLRCRVLALPLWFAPDQPTIDSYLWTPHCTANIKLRYGDLKFKRFLACDGRLECWLEDENEVFPFPLEPGTLAELGRMLGVSTAVAQPVVRERFPAILAAALPPVQVIQVTKKRRLHLWPQENHEPVIVELTEIVEPEPICTVAVEHRDRDRVGAVLAHLEADLASLRPLNYLQALAIWARGGRVAALHDALQCT